MFRLSGFELRNFRSIGERPVVIYPLKKCNILVGQNNAGKSNVLRAIQRISERHRKNQLSLEDLDLHKRSKEKPFIYKLFFESVGEHDEIVAVAGTSQFDFEFSWSPGSPTKPIDHSIARITDFDRSNEILDRIAHKHWTVRVNANEIRKELLNLGELIFSRFAASIPQVNIIPEFRQIRAPVAGETTEYGLSGKSLIELLASYQHPEDGRDHERVKFDHIEKFVRKLLHLPEATLEVTHSKDKIMLTNNGLRLPLASYGTGVHELVILVTAVLSIENAICCIEEPEIHLHPRLQREFIDFISSETANQYLISTHSPTFINALNSNDNLQVFHLQLENGATIGGPISKDSESLTALHDLGMKASDILQSNCILWVEGPSDRIYLKRWIELLAPGLVEGRDYSVMFYGGRLLSHISADREKVPDEFLHILAINQNAVVVMDSDCKQEGDNINETKRRVKEECERNGDICWVTEGREVENYLSERVVKAVCGELCGKQVEISIEPYAKLEQEIGDSLAAAGATNFDYSKDKIKYARLFAQQYKVDDLVSPLRERVEEIVARIKFWNE